MYNFDRLGKRNLVYANTSEGGEDTSQIDSLHKRQN